MDFQIFMSFCNIWNLFTSGVKWFDEESWYKAGSKSRLANVLFKVIEIT